MFFSNPNDFASALNAAERAIKTLEDAAQAKNFRVSDDARRRLYVALGRLMRTRRACIDAALRDRYGDRYNPEIAKHKFAARRDDRQGDAR